MKPNIYKKESDSGSEPMSLLSNAVFLCDTILSVSLYDDGGCNVRTREGMGFNFISLFLIWSFIGWQQCFSTGGDFIFQGIYGDVYRHVCLSPFRLDWKVLLASSSERSGICWLPHSALGSPHSWETPGYGSTMECVLHLEMTLLGLFAFCHGLCWVWGQNPLL